MLPSLDRRRPRSKLPPAAGCIRRLISRLICAACSREILYAALPVALSLAAPAAHAQATVSFDSAGVLVVEAEEGGTVSLTVTVDSATVTDLIVGYDVGIDDDPFTADADESDYRLGGGGVTIEAGETTAAVSIAIVDDDAIEPTSESFTVSLTAGAPATTGYEPGFPATAAVIIREGVCDRTEAVRDRILRRLGATDCANVTAVELSRINALALIDQIDLLSPPKDIGGLRVGDFSGLGNLQRLLLDRTSLPDLPSGVFSGLSNLQSLSLNGNQLAALPPGVFSDLDSLQELHLSSNRLTTLGAGVFSGLRNLQSLTLYGNQLTTLTTGVFSDLSNLQSLSLNGNRLTTLTAGVFSDLSNLQTLSLENNRLTTLRSGTFLGLSGLRSLSLVGNQLAAPASGAFSGLSGLQSLFLDHNRLTTLRSGTFSGLSGLQRLSLRHNRLTTLTAGVFSALGNLGTLDLDQNRIGGLSADAFLGLGKLRNLDMLNNRLPVLPPGVFSSLGELRHLNLHGNQLETLPPDVFSALGKLTSLWLIRNRLRELPADVFSNLGRLQRLLLQQNQLSELPPGVFSALGNLISLNLDHNRLNELPAGVFSGLFNLRELRLFMNQAQPFVLTPRLRRVDEPDASMPGPAELRLVVDQGAPSIITVNLSVEGGLPAASTVTIPRGSTESRSFTVTQIRAEPVRMDWVVAELPHNYVGIETAGDSLSLDLGETPLVLSIAPESSRVPVVEGGTAAVIIRANRPSPTAVVAAYRVGGDGDTAGADDYATPPGGEGTVTIAAGETTAAVLIPITDDAVVEPPRERFTVSLTAGAPGATGYELGFPATAAVIIREGVCDRTPEVQDEILFESSLEDCAAVTVSDLEGIEDELLLNEYFLDSLEEGDFSGLVNLRTLDLSYNDLTELASNTFSDLGKLRELYLNDNELTALPAGVFSSLGDLQRLLLDENLLDTLTSSVFSGLGGLQELDLADNALATLPPGVFSALGGLRTLRLGANPLESLTSDVFSGLGGLQALYLEAVEFDDLPSGVFSNLGSLQRLDLIFNRLRTLPAGFFSGLSELRTLNLNDNHLDELPQGLFSGLDNLENLNLLNNPGVPFVFTVPRLERAGSGDASVPGAAEVRLVVDQAAPATITAGLSAEGGELSLTTVMISKGETESSPFSVRQRAGAAVALSASAGRLSGYFGIETAESEPLILDLRGPSISGAAVVSAPARGDAYLAPANEIIRVALGFDEEVKVTTSTAGPVLLLKLGETTRAASYAPDLSGGSTLVFSYALQAGDADEDGVSVEADALRLMGAEITDVSMSRHPLVSASLGSHTVSDAAGHKVVGRELRLSFAPPVILLAEGDSTRVNAELVLGGAETLTGEDAVNVSLTPTEGLELVTSPSVTMDARTSRVSVTLDIREPIAGLDERLTATARTSPPNTRVVAGLLRILGPSTATRLRIRLFLEGALE